MSGNTVSGVGQQGIQEGGTTIQEEDFQKQKDAGTYENNRTKFDSYDDFKKYVSNWNVPLPTKDANGNEHQTIKDASQDTQFDVVKHQDGSVDIKGVLKPVQDSSLPDATVSIHFAPPPHQSSGSGGGNQIY